MSVVVTGGAGFIGSCVVRTLNDIGIEDIIVVDNIKNTGKWMNLRNKSYISYVNRDDFPKMLKDLEGITHIIHMGACSSTTEYDFDFLNKNNIGYTTMLWNYCTEHDISFIYASSAATYGDGSNGFDDECDIRKLRPLNPYGYSKQRFDLWAEKQNKTPRQHVGFKFFNVYGPNEYYKCSMASVVFHTFNKISETGRMGLFKSYNEKYPDGGQLRDFVYVKDVCNVIKFAFENERINGLFNIGTGKARSFYDLAAATFEAMGMEPAIDFIEMPENLKDKYQYYTQAEMYKLRSAGYSVPFYSLEDGVSDYVQNYLMKGCEAY